jgi:hypothetical protein
VQLSELTGVKQYRDKDLEQVFMALKAFVTGGSASRVIVKDDTVWKFWVQDNAYEKFIKYSLAHSNIGALPKFKSGVKMFSPFFKRPKGFPEKIKYVKMEKLEELGHNENILDANASIVSFCQRVANMPAKTYDDQVQHFKLFKISDETTLNLKQIYKIIHDLQNVYDGDELLNADGDNGLDLHNGNIMRRGSTFVIVDPGLLHEDWASNDDLESALDYPMPAPGRTSPEFDYGVKRSVKQR